MENWGTVQDGMDKAAAVDLLGDPQATEIDTSSDEYFRANYIWGADNRVYGVTLVNGSVNDRFSYQCSKARHYDYDWVGTVCG